MAGLKAAAGLAQVGGADVDGHIGRIPKGIQQGGHLFGTAGAEFQHQGAGGQGRGDGTGMGVEQGLFRAGELVFRLVADFGKQFRPPLVVEQPGRQLPGLALQPSPHRCGHIRRRRMQVDQFKGRQLDHHGRARRRPLACQRQWGPKKLR
jgi:hypothetical protein